MLVKQQKTTLNPPFDPRPHKVTRQKGWQLYLEREGKVLVRNAGQVKKIKKRPDRLQTTTTKRGKEDISGGVDTTDIEDDFEINLPSSPER